MCWRPEGLLSLKPKCAPWHCIDQSRWHMFITEDLGRYAREIRGPRSLTGYTVRGNPGIPEAASE